MSPIHAITHSPISDVTAIVTGGNKGIGFAIADAILAGGGRVMIGGRTAATVDAAVASLSKTHGADRIGGAVADVRSRASVEALVTATLHKFSRVNVLVNNAGVGAFAEIGVMSDADWSRVIDTNLTGVFYCTRAVLPHLKSDGGGWIINIASLAARNYFPGGGAYCASKAALVAFSESLMQEVRVDNIRVSVVMPGSVATEFSGPHGRHEDDSWKLTPDDVAQTVMDLLRHPGRSLPSKIEIRPAKTK